MPKTFRANCESPNKGDKTTNVEAKLPNMDDIGNVFLLYSNLVTHISEKFNLSQNICKYIDNCLTNIYIFVFVYTIS